MHSIATKCCLVSSVQMLTSVQKSIEYQILCLVSHFGLQIIRNRTLNGLYCKEALSQQEVLGQCLPSQIIVREMGLLKFD